MTDEERERKERLKEYRRRYREMHGRETKGRPWKKGLLAVAVLGLAGCGAFFGGQYAAASAVTVGGVGFGHDEEGLNGFLDQQEASAAGEELTLQINDGGETKGLADLDVHLDREKILDEALLVGRRGSFAERVSDIASVLVNGKDVPLSLTVDGDKLDAYLDDVHRRYDRQPENAFAEPTAEGVAIHPEKEGVVIDTSETKAQLADMLAQGHLKPLAVPVAERSQAGVKAADLQQIDTVLTYYTTHFDPADTNRTANIALAQNLLNHALISPQSQFSFNDFIGTRTKEKGYKDAPVYMDNQVVMDAGGGVCQVSTTLFNAALRAGLMIYGRSPHFAPAGYVPVGLDATVADNGPDLVFSNPFDHPIYCYTVMGTDTITVYILGNHADTCSVSFRTLSQKTLPHQVIYKHQDGITAEQRQQEGYDGHEISIARYVQYSDGVTYSNVISSRYEANAEIILTPGVASEKTVQTTNLGGEQLQDAMMNFPHDPVIPGA